MSLSVNSTLSYLVSRRSSLTAIIISVPSMYLLTFGSNLVLLSIQFETSLCSILAIPKQPCALYLCGYSAATLCSDLLIRQHPCAPSLPFGSNLVLLTIYLALWNYLTPLLGQSLGHVGVFLSSFTCWCLSVNSIYYFLSQPFSYYVGERFPLPSVIIIAKFIVSQVAESLSVTT